MPKHCNNHKIDLDANFNVVKKPEHYHKYALDTIAMLRDGFPPEVLRGFLIGNIYKYIQRYQLKNGHEDLRKAMRYMELLMDEEKPL